MSDSDHSGTPHLGGVGGQVERTQSGETRCISAQSSQSKTSSFRCLRLYDSLFRREKVILSPGDLAVSNEEIVLYTVLGSCVSVTLFDPSVQVAGMNHYMLPRPLSTSALKHSKTGRFGEHAMKTLLEQMFSLGAKKEALVAKVFGGGHVLKIDVQESGVWEQNQRFAFEFLEKEGIRVAASDVGGPFPRRVSLVVRTGSVYVQKLEDRG